MAKRLAKPRVKTLGSNRCFATSTASGDAPEAAATASGEGVARVAAKTPVKVGDRMTFGVDVEDMQFFDPKTGLAIRG